MSEDEPVFVPFRFDGEDQPGALSILEDVEQPFLGALLQHLEQFETEYASQDGGRPQHLRALLAQPPEPGAHDHPDSLGHIQVLG